MKLTEKHITTFELIFDNSIIHRNDEYDCYSKNSHDNIFYKTLFLHGIYILFVPKAVLIQRNAAEL